MKALVEDTGGPIEVGTTGAARTAASPAGGMTSRVRIARTALPVIAKALAASSTASRTARTSTARSAAAVTGNVNAKPATAAVLGMTVVGPVTAVTIVVGPVIAAMTAVPSTVPVRIAASIMITYL